MAGTTQIPRESTSEQLRADIDAGRTGDKVSVSDPAAAPLGADEEAAGTPVDPETVSAARLQERRTVQSVSSGRRVGAAWILVAVIATFAAATLMWAI
jgi:hypothetical protein